jgi:hypothetical protein
MRNVLIGLGVLTALAQNVQTASAQGTTSVKITKATVAGTGPYTITSEGLVSIKIGEVFMGVQYQVLDLPQAALLTSASPTSPMVRPSLAWQRVRLRETAHLSPGRETIECSSRCSTAITMGSYERCRLPKM